MKKILALAMVAGVASFAAAEPVSLHFEGLSRGRNVSISAHDQGWFNVFSGSVIHDLNGESLVTFCIDPDQWVQTGTRNFERESLEDALSNRSDNVAKAWAIAELSRAAGPDLWTDSADKDLSAAFQLAVWEVILDLDPVAGVSSLNLSHGEFRASGAGHSSLSHGIIDYYDQLVGSLTLHSMNTQSYEAYANSSYQDFVSHVPTPGSGALALVALPLVATRRRGQQR